MYNGRYLKRNHSSAVPRSMVFFDTETLPGPPHSNGRRVTHSLRLGVAQRGRLSKGKLTRMSEIVFFQSSDFWEWCFKGGRSRETTWIIAHSALFDLFVAEFWELFDQGVVEIDRPRTPREGKVDENGKKQKAILAVIDDPPTIIGFRHLETQARYVVVDTLNYFRTKLEDMGHACGLPKLEMPAFDEPDEAWIQYCRRDVEIVRETFLGLVKWISARKYGMFRRTAPSQAMAAFRHRFMGHDVVLHDREDVKSIERACYFGGQSEVYRQGTIPEEVHQYDVTSLYPSVMLNNQFPCRLMRWDCRYDLLHLRPDINLARSIAVVELDTSRETFPLRLGRQVVYSLGRFVTGLAGPELAFAAEGGLIRRWGSWAEYEAVPLFSEYVRHFWRARVHYRSRNQWMYEQFCKLMLNSLYGKWGQLSPRWEDRPDMIAPDPWSQWSVLNRATSERREYRSIGWHVQQKVERGEFSGSFPAIAAFVTAHGRQKMRELRRIAGNRNVLYQGVDCLVLTNAGRDNLERAGETGRFELGKLEHQLSVAGGEIWGVGDYCLGAKQTMSGRKATADHLFGPWYIEDKFIKGGNLFRGTAPSGVDVQTIISKRLREYQKGTVGIDGWIEPFVVEQEERACDDSQRTD